MKTPAVISPYLCELRSFSISVSASSAAFYNSFLPDEEGERERESDRREENEGTKSQGDEYRIRQK